MKTIQLLIYDAILDGDAKRFRDQLLAAGTSCPVELRINSVGGLVFEGYAIYNALREHKGKITIYIDGIAASMASYIAMVGKPIIMAENALMMIHNPSGGSFGDAEDMRKHAVLLDKISESMVEVYAKRTHLPRKKMQEMMKDETWLTADMALAMGFVDEVSAPLQLAAVASKTLPPATIAKIQNNSSSQIRELRAELIERRGQAVLQAGEVRDLKARVVSLSARSEKAEKELTLLESFCKSKGFNLTGTNRAEAVGETPYDYSSGDILAQLERITDPVEHTKFYRANQAKIDGAWASRNRNAA